MIIGIQLENNKEGREFVEKTNERVKKGFLFKGGAVFKIKDSILYSTFIMDAIIPRASLVGFYILLLGLALKFAFGLPFLAFGILGGLAIASDYFRTIHFSFNMLKLGLKKAKYKGKIAKLSDNEIMEVFINGTT